MVLEPNVNVLSSNLDHINSPQFQLNIARVRSHLLKKSLNLHVRGKLSKFIYLFIFLGKDIVN
jgi:hypothetical protein